MRPAQYIKSGLGLMMLVWWTVALAPPVDAEAVGSPSSILKKGKWVMGLGGGAMGRHLKGVADALVFQGGHFRGYGLTDWLSVYGKVGGASLEVDDSTIVKLQDPSTQNSFGGNILFSVQAKGKLLEHKRWGWEWDWSAQYVDIRARHKGKNAARWHEWQLAMSTAKSMGRLKPYVGAKYSIVNMLFRVWDNGSLLKQGRYREDNPVGIFVGTDYYFGQYEDVILNIEGSYLDGPEIAMALSYSF